MKSNSRLLVSILIVSALGLRLSARIIYVDGNAAGTDDGTSWENAYGYLQDALADAKSTEGPVEVRVAQGVYKPDQAREIAVTDRREASFFLVDGCRLRGGYAGHGGPDPNERDATRYPSILSGDLDGNDALTEDFQGMPGELTRADNSYHVVRCDVLAAVLDGFVVTAGNACEMRYANGWWHSDGGGVYNRGNELLISNCRFEGNASSDWGGAIRNYGGQVRIDACRFWENVAQARGGGIYNAGSSCTITACQFIGNKVVSPRQFEGGGGIYNAAYSRIADCVFLRNEVASDKVASDEMASTDYLSGGGGILNQGADPEIEGCTFEKNTAREGGGIANVTADPRIVDCLFNANNCTYAGGGIVNADSSPHIVNCRFIGNEASFGGAVFGVSFVRVDSKASLYNCVFSGNSAHYMGGAIDHWLTSDWPTDSTILNCAFFGNSAMTHGGAISVRYGSLCTISNSLLWANRASDRVEQISIQEEDTVSHLRISHTGIEGGRDGIYHESDSRIDWGAGMMEEDPLFVDADGLDNKLGTDDDNLRLLQGSPYLDAGSNEMVPSDMADLDRDGNTAEPLPFDMAGGPRFLDSPEVEDKGLGAPPIVDLGAFEGATCRIRLLVEPSEVTISEGGTAAFSVRLAMDPQGPVTVRVVRASGDDDIRVESGKELQFDSANYSVGQDVILRAAHDADNMNGAASIAVYVPGVLSHAVAVVERDDEPIPRNLYVDWQAQGLNTGRSWIDAFTDLQQALEIAQSSTSGEHEIWVAEGEYRPAQVNGGPSTTFRLADNLKIYGGFPPGGGSLAERDPDSHRTILSGDLNINDDISDGSRSDNAYHVVTAIQTGPGTVIDGFTVTGGNAIGMSILDALGGGMYIHKGSLIVANCRFERNRAEFGGGLYSYDGNPRIMNCRFFKNQASAHGGGIHCYLRGPVITECTFTENRAHGIKEIYGRRYGGGLYLESCRDLCFQGFNRLEANRPDGMWMGYCHEVEIDGEVRFLDNDIVGHDVMLGGRGILHAAPASSLDLKDSTTITCRVQGGGAIRVDAGAELTVADHGQIDLGSYLGVTGEIRCSGLLQLTDWASIRNASVLVARAEFGDNAILDNCVIAAEAGTPYGQLFVQDHVSVNLDRIEADGDRYLDLDPAKFNCNNIHVNAIDVHITEGIGHTQGGLFELRGKPLAEILPGASVSYVNGSVGIVHVGQGGEQAGIPAFGPDTWTLDTLELREGAKLNLTNRFDFQSPLNAGGDDEALYVKELIIRRGSVLNTAYNRVYCERLDNQGEIVSVPLLGFSLNNIACDNEIDFSTRVKTNNYDDPDDDPRKERVLVTREPHALDANGVMYMRNLHRMDPSVTDAEVYRLYHARAKGLFSKVREEDILIRFEYLFDSPGGELAVYLSDVPELLPDDDPRRDINDVEVARLPHPPAGRPGSWGSREFGVFERTVPAGDLNFIRGMRMELELIGPEGTGIVINNWDPVIRCVTECGDVVGITSDLAWVEYHDAADFLAVMSLCGSPISDIETLTGTDKWCVDGPFSRDGVVTLDDAIAVAWMRYAYEWLPCDASPPVNSLTAQSIPHDGMPLMSAGAGAWPPDTAMVVVGKPYHHSLDDYPKDLLRGLDEALNPVEPFGQSADSEVTAGLVWDSQKKQLYRLDLATGLAPWPPLTDAPWRIGPHEFSGIDEPRYQGGAWVFVGRASDCPADREDEPIQDVAFDKQGFAYVVPVQVEPDDPDKRGYRAAAKLRQTPDDPSSYSIVQLYDLLEPNDNLYDTGLHRIEVIEVDGRTRVYVLNEHDLNRSDQLWIYDGASGVPEVAPLDLRLLDSNISAPTVMHVSARDGRVYLATGIHAPDADFALLHVLPGSLSGPVEPELVRIEGIGHVTGITEDPSTGRLFVIGFTLDSIPFDEELNTGADTLFSQPFYQGYIAEIERDGAGYQVVGPINLSETCDLALPLSIVWTGPQ